MRWLCIASLIIPNGERETFATLLFPQQNFTIHNRITNQIKWKFSFIQLYVKKFSRFIFWENKIFVITFPYTPSNWKGKWSVWFEIGLLCWNDLTFKSCYMTTSHWLANHQQQLYNDTAHSNSCHFPLWQFI